MNARTHHFRYVGLCAAMLLALAVVACVGEEVGPLLWKALSVAPFTFAGTFLFNHFQSSREGNLNRRKVREAVPPEAEGQFANLVYLVTLALGVISVAVAVLAPAHLPRLVWVVQVLAGAAGIHAQALT